MTHRSLLFPLTLVALITPLAARAEGVKPRLRIRFDANWQFRRDPDQTVASPVGPFSWQWKRVETGSVDIKSLPADLESGGWQDTRLGRTVMRDRVRWGWFRTNLGSNAADAAKALTFESVDDNAVVFLNGVLLGKHEGYGDEFSFAVKDAWKPAGPNTLYVLIENTGGEGGINGGITLESPAGPALTPPEASPTYVDSKWRTVHLPHDYVVEGTFKKGEDVGHGSLPKPTAWYRKSFDVPASYKDKAVWIDFDGVYRNSTVYLNGEKLGTESSGYIGFRYDISSKLKYGKKNVLAVHVDPRKNEGWWYEGGGIYRHVWLNVADSTHIQPDSTFVKSTVNGAGATISASFSVQAVGAPLKVVSSVVDPKGHVLAAATVTGPSAGEFRQNFVLPKAMLWSIEQPNLYKFDAKIYRGSKLVDRVITPFGIRTTRFDKDKGFFLNGKPVKLKGTCNHQDHAGVGIAMPDGLLDWRIRKLKEMGSNAYRCSHNPPAAELLEACDRLGMLVMDETRHLGDTTLPKSPRGTKADNLSELKRLVLRDRNHPSVIMWSLYNEEGLQGTDEGAQIFLKMKAAVDALDGTRPSSGATNFGYGAGIQNVTDLFGFNYNIYAYDEARRKYPNQAMFGSETASTVSTRGIYANDAAKGYVSAYDVNHPAWAETAEHAWKPLAERDWMAGGFVWTGFDYKGEPTPFEWPCINSHFGILDICGFPKDNFFYYKAWWGNKPVVHVLPHWNWPGKEGQNIDVWVQSNAEEVELILNGKSLGKKAMPKYEHLSWSVPYTPGTVEARGYSGGKLIASDKVETTGVPAAIRLKTTRTKLLADNEDLSPVEVEIIDAKGRVVPDASNLIQFEVEGPGAVVGVGNGDPSDHDPDKATKRKAFSGLCMALVGAKGDAGKIVLTATGSGLRSASIEITTRKADKGQ